MKGAQYLLLLLLLSYCSPKKDQPKESTPPVKGTFGFDRNFLEQYKNIHVLKSGNSQVIVVGDYQGRVMTSTANGDAGTSFGWINYDLIASGQLKPHMNAFGGEDRFWMGPEGGQYSIFFPKGSKFEFEHWQTPALIDSEPFDVRGYDSVSISFTKAAKLVNYQGFEFDIEIDRDVELVSVPDIEREFGITLGKLKAVCYKTENMISNTGDKDWTKQSGLLSIWILGMFIPTPATTIVVPFDRTSDPTQVTDNYFGSIPADRIVKTDSMLLLKGDGKFRGKVGIAPTIAKNIAGSYAADKHILTLVKFDVDKKAEYVNSKWEMQKHPFSGDAVNSYNDGPLADGSQMGPFYEIESSSPARELKRGEQLIHKSITLHLEGDEAELDLVSRKALGISLGQINSVFKK